MKGDDNHVGTIEGKCGGNFHVRSAMHLTTLLKKLGKQSLNDLIMMNEWFFGANLLQLSELV